MFTGDAFGLCYPQLQGGTRAYFNYVCAPPQFDPIEAKKSIQRILDVGPDRIFLTHFGQCGDIRQGAEQLMNNMDTFDAVADTASQTDLQGKELLEYCTQRAWEVTRQELVHAGLDPEDRVVYKWATAEHSITSQGVAMLAEKRRKDRAENT